MTTYVALLYSIQIANGKRLVMSDLREMAGSLKLGKPRTVLATGNLVFEAPAEPLGALEARLERAFAARFGRQVPIIICRGSEWPSLMAANPFPAESAREPSRVLVRVQRASLPEDFASTLQPCCRDGEVARVAGGHLWMYFPGNIGNLKLAAAVTIKRAGTGTARNWNTIQRIASLL